MADVVGGTDDDRAAGATRRGGLTVGADWKSGTDYSATLPKAGSVPKTAQALNGADAAACMPIYWPYVYHGG
ncbi:hypothetical protein OG552_13425 [Streptomyces sp. NBC_01476]|uniref:hypothetical protein n=1 Tax=Streptomyces sp. NBC_01476 TaxID=2903881 RepID=UPI002E3802CD|nr:hypothetical protein [Streptomyces sp. NBC_01476]